MNHNDFPHMEARPELDFPISSVYQPQITQTDDILSFIKQSTHPSEISLLAFDQSNPQTKNEDSLNTFSINGL
jgi:hypothetical protein